MSPVDVPPRTRRLAEAGVLLTVLVWSANFVVVKAAIGTMGPMTFTSIRYVVAAATLLAVLRWRQGAFHWPRGRRIELFALGTLGFGAYQVLWATGLTQVTAGDSALLVATSPVLTALLAGAVGMDRLTPPKLIGALVAFAGVALVVAGGHTLELGSSLLGDGLTLTAAAIWAVYAIWGARVLRTIDPLQATTWTVVAGTIVLAPVGLLEAVGRPAIDVTPAAVVAILYSGALAAGIANVLVFNAMRYVGPTRVTATQFLVPPSAVLLGAVFLAEPVGIGQLAGGAVIVGGLWLTRRRGVVPAGVRARLSSRA